MSVENLGTIGQNYENRKSGKTGVLVNRDVERGALVMNDGCGLFNITAGDFRSNWRKCKDVECESCKAHISEEVMENADEETIHEFVNANVAQTVIPMTDAEFYDVAFNGREGIITGTPDDFIVTLVNCGQKFEVLHGEKMSDGYYSVRMFPDIYTFSEFTGHCKHKSFDITVNDSVTVLTDFTEWGEILAVTAQAINELNLYGYTFEKEE